jgi:DNA-binding NarL/FixJ family response regulator
VSILERQRLMRDTLSELMGRAGAQVVGLHADAERYLMRLRIEQPTLSVIDLDAAGSGPDDAKAFIGDLRHGRPDLRLVVYTDCVDPLLVEHCYREGVSAYLDRASTDAATLVSAVSAAARGERLVPAHLLHAPFQPSAPAATAPLLHGLSTREREVLSFVAAGADNLKIATLLKISERTVKAHLSSLYRKVGSENRTQLALAALQFGVRPRVEV